MLNSCRTQREPLPCACTSTCLWACSMSSCRASSKACVEGVFTSEYQLPRIKIGWVLCVCSGAANPAPRRLIFSYHTSLLLLAYVHAHQNSKLPSTPSLNIFERNVESKFLHTFGTMKASPHIRAERAAVRHAAYDALAPLPEARVRKTGWVVLHVSCNSIAGNNVGP